MNGCAISGLKRQLQHLVGVINLRKSGTPGHLVPETFLGQPISRDT